MAYSYKQFNIIEVKDWLLGNNPIQLPAIQRGFVWSASQIENLWDSIFKEYPIGTFTITNTNDLLDGQQRATSIALGFYNPWKHPAINQIGNAKNLPVLWINLPLNSNETISFRVVTQAQPWGYQLLDNTKVLSISDRIKASSNFTTAINSSELMYTKISACDRRPYDSAVPIPLCWLLEEAQKDAPNAIHILDLCKKNLPANSMVTKGSGNYFNDLETLYKDGTIDKVLQKIKRSVLECQFVSTIIDILKIEDSSQDSDDITLFVRINTAGTKISGDELMYSYFKSICPEIKEAIEQQNISFISPVKIVNLVSRLTKSLQSNNQEYIDSINLSKFKGYLKNENYKRELLNNINNEAKSLIEKACNILQFAGMPNVIVRQFIQKGSNGFLMLIYWLHNTLSNITEEIQRNICRNLYGHFFLGDLDEYVKANWRFAKGLNFWNKVNENLYSIPYVAPHLLEACLKRKIEQGTTDLSLTTEDETIKTSLTTLIPQGNISNDSYNLLLTERYNLFISKVLTSKSLILFAQRQYINNKFKDFNQLVSLQDTNTPWDWDHIYPNSWVYNRKGIASSVKFWEWKIGNFRAMSFIDNRSENNNWSPAERLQDVENDFFICSNDGEYWKKLDKYHKIKIIDKEDCINHAMAIMLRSVNIYQEFYINFVDPNYRERTVNSI